MPTNPLVAVALVFLLGGCAEPGSPTSETLVPEQIALGVPGSGGAVRIDGDVAVDPSGIGVALCAVPDGDLYVVWADDRRDPGSGAMDLWLNRSSDGVSWLDAPLRVNAGRASPIWSSALACSDLGAFVVWEAEGDGELGNHQLSFNRSTDGETFAPEDLEFDPDGLVMSIGPQIAIRGEDVHVVWADDRNGSYDIFDASSSDAGGSFRSPVRLDTDEPAGGAWSGRPRVAFGATALDVAVVWEDARDGQLDIQFARSDNGGTSFRENDRLDGGDPRGAAHSFRPEVCTDGAEVTVVWHDARPGGDKRDVYTNRSPDGGQSWLDEAERLDDRAQGASGHPVCAAGDGGVHLAWTEDTGEVWTRGLDGGEPVLLGEGREPRIGARDGTVAVAWSGSDGVSAARVDGDGGSPVRLGGSAVQDLAFAVHAGEAVAAWTDPGGRVWFGRAPLDP